MTNRQNFGDPEAYRRLTRDLTNMYGTERRELDVAPFYAEALELTAAGQDTEAVALVSSLQNAAGEAWRQRAFEHGLIAAASFSNIAVSAE